MNLLRRIPLRLIGILLLGYILYVIDLHEVLARLRQIGSASILAAIAAFVALLVFRCWRWHVLVVLVHGHGSMLANFASCNESIWLGLATPGRVGEFGRGLDLARRTGAGVAASSALVAFDLVLDLLAFAILCAAGVLLLLVRSDPTTDQFVYLGLVAAGFICLVFMSARIAALFARIPWLGDLPGLSSLLPILATRLTGRSRGAWGIAIATAGASLSYAAMIAALVAPMGLGLSTTQTLTMVGVVGLSGAVPITYFGFGTREAAIIWYFGQLHLTAETAVAVSFLFLLAQLIGIAVSLTIAVTCRRLVEKRGRAEEK